MISSKSITVGVMLTVASLLVGVAPVWAQCTTGAWSAETGTVQAIGISTSPKGKYYEGDCALTVDTAAAPGFVTTNSPIDEPLFTARFYFLPDQFDLSSGEAVIFRARNNNIVQVRLSLREAGGVLNLVAAYRSGAVLQEYGEAIPLLGTWQGVTLSWSAGNGDGAFSLKLDDNLQFTAGGLSNGGEVVNEVDLGVINDPAATGKLVFDAFEMRRTGEAPPLLTVEELLNISTRAEVGDGDRIVIAGFVIRGDTRKCVVVRGRGQSVPVPGNMTDPRLIVKSGQTTVDENDNWLDHPTASILTQLGRQPAHENDAALHTCLGPGPYTALLRPAAGSSLGVGIVEVIDVDLGTSYLKNISTRAYVGVPAPTFPIAGFIIRGNQPRQVLIRGRGPSLEGAPGITSPILADPMLILKSGSSTVVENDNWKDAANWLDIDATGSAPGFDAESTILVTLQPGPYTVWLRSANGQAGLGIVEVLDVLGGSIEMN